MVTGPNPDYRSIGCLSEGYHQTRNHHWYQTGGAWLATSSNGIGKHVHHNRNRRETENGRLGCHNVRNGSFDEWKERSYPAGDGENRHRNVEHRHDEEIENAILENRSQQPGHAGLAVVNFELVDKGDNAEEGDKICWGVRFLGICETTGDKYQRTRPATCRPTCRPQVQ